jgi:hypothetical protein
MLIDPNNKIAMEFLFKIKNLVKTLKAIGIFFLMRIKTS